MVAGGPHDLAHYLGRTVCGLFGIAGSSPDSLDAALVGKLFSLLDHRGPDDRGWLTLERAGIRTGSAPEALSGDAVLLHTRLSILDLSSAGHQPMSTPDGRFHLSFNGEIYNYIELRRELESLDHRFVSSSDTEVLLAAYAQWGTASLQRLVGMFAFAVLDTERRTLVLARDQFGIKPLYYSPLPNRLAFASEIPPLLALPGVSRRADPQRAYDYLRWARIDHGAATMFTDIRQVQPAHYLEVALDAPERLAEVPYWQLEPEPVDGLTLDGAAERLRELFLESVRLHLRSDVPVGAAFSGGIDSSGNVAAMRSLSGDGLDLHTFSYVPEDPELSEERWISLMVRKTGAVAHSVTPAPQELQTDLDRLIDVQAEPFGSTSIYAQYRVFQLAREAGVKVMLDGQGPDELFGGYRPYLPARLAGLLSRGQLLSAARFVAAISTLPGMTSTAVARTVLRGSSTVAKSSLPDAIRMSSSRLKNRASLPDWLDGSWLADRGVVLPGPFRAVSGTSALRQELREAVRSNLRTLLRYEDRNSMAASIETRVPYLTPAIAEFAAGLPDHYLIGPDGLGKLVLRRSLRGLVPDQILDRRDKIGFNTPESSWLLSLEPWVDGVLDSEAARAGGPLRIAEARKSWHAARDGRGGVDPATWRWLNFVRWVDRFRVELA
jgi:asparagine synthase (glutamine-hydrolysing)